MSENLGMGVMLRMLSGRGETAAALVASIGKRIASVTMNADDLVIRFEGGNGVRLWDAGQSCCESRYMTCDDDLGGYAGAEIRGIETRGAPSVADSDYGEHEVQFLVVTTDRGAITCATHNEHNGYYGGFAIEAASLGEGA